MINEPVLSDVEVAAIMLKHNRGTSMVAGIMHEQQVLANDRELGRNADPAFVALVLMKELLEVSE